MSGEYQSSGRMRAGSRELDDEAVETIARQVEHVAGMGPRSCDPRALAVALGYQTAWAPELPNGVTSMVVGKTIYYANSESRFELSRRIALPLAHLILEAWGYDLAATDRLSVRLTG
jgi:hypothetical protein